MDNSSIIKPSLASFSLISVLKSQWMIYGTAFLLLAASSFFIEEYLAYIATSWVIFGILALSLDLVWGKGGMLSLGHTVFYGLGGYLGSVAAINFAPVTGNTLIWSLPIGAITGLVSASLVGWFIFYNRMGQLQSTILTYTVTLILWTASVSFSIKIGDAVVGGDNGMSNIPGIVLGFGTASFGTASFGTASNELEPNAMFLTVVLIAGILFLLAKMLINSPFGTIVDCIRLDPVKTELLGYDIRRIRLILFAFSGSIAGIAGALFGAWANYLNPSIFSVQEALLVPIYVLVGGLGTLIGPFIGAMLVGGLSFWLGGGALGGQTTLIIGVCLIIMVLFLQRGIMGAILTVIDFCSDKLTKKSNDEVSHDVGVKFNIDLLKHLQRKPTRGDKLVLATLDVSKSFGGITPVDRISLDFASGTVQCIIGPNGAGKSSFIKTCTGVYKPDKGQIMLADVDITNMDTFERVNLGLGIKMQTAQVFDNLNLWQNLWVAAYSKDRNRKKAGNVADNMLQMLGMTKHAGIPASKLSHGEQQWLDIGMVLCLSPDIIILDEPAAGMTRHERGQLSELLRALVKNSVVIIVEHDMDFVRTLMAEVIVIHQGKVFAQGDIETLRKDERILDIYLGRRKNVLNL